MGGWPTTDDAPAVMKSSAGAIAIPVLCVVLILSVLIALTIGAYPITLEGFWSAIARLWSGESAQTPEERVLLNIRGPRVIAGILVGASLASAGVVYQGLFRNPLVSPDILGVSAGAGLGAVLGIFLSLPLAAIQGLAFVGGIATVSLVYVIASAVRGRDPTLVLVLGGVVVGALAGAAISLLKILADPYDQLPAITFWLLGSLASTRGAEITGALPAVLIGLVPLVLLRWRINVLSLGDEEARSLASLLEQQRDRIGKASKDFNPDQLTLDLVPEERREREADRRHWQTRLARLEQDLRDEPKRLRDSYEVKAHRLEPVGIVYLWPVSG